MCCSTNTQNIVRSARFALQQLDACTKLSTTFALFLILSLGYTHTQLRSLYYPSLSLMLLTWEKIPGSPRPEKVGHSWPSLVKVTNKDTVIAFQVRDYTQCGMLMNGLLPNAWLADGYQALNNFAYRCNAMPRRETQVLPWQHWVCQCKEVIARHHCLLVGSWGTCPSWIRHG